MRTTGAALNHPDPGSGRRPGRPYDHSRDAEILECTLDLLAEGDLEHVTLDEVAARTGKAKTTIYRRWATKDDLVLAAIRAAGRPPELAQLPDLGSLRADLLAVLDSSWLGGPERRLAIFGSLSSARRNSPRLLEFVQTDVEEPYVQIYRRLLDRAAERGEVAARFAGSIPVLAEVIPAMSSHRFAKGGKPVRREFFVSVVDDVVLAALHTTGGT